MTEPVWAAVDHYITEHLVPADAVLEAALQASAAAGMPAINVSPPQGKLLWMLARLHGARRILEIGTLGAYSTIWLARALPADGRLVTLELEPQRAELARRNLAHAGLSGLVEVRVGAALDTLPQLAADGFAPVDLTFIDADKENNPGYFAWALQLSRPGSLIIVDNVVRNGAVLEAASSDPIVQGVRRLYELMGAEPRVTTTVLQTVGSKGYDGLAVALVTS